MTPRTRVPCGVTKTPEKDTMKKIALAILTIVLFASLMSGRPYHGLNAGIAWDWGGVELVGQPGLFVCPQAPFAPLFPSLVADC
jgi:hypothetical protein